MTNSTISKRIALYMALVLVFAMFGVTATQAQAGYYYGASSYNYNNTFGNTYSYSARPAPQPVYIQTPVYYQTPTYVQPTYVQPTYYQTPVTYYSPLSVSCSANNTYVSGYGSITWNAYASGGNGNYTYSWSGTDGLYGSNQSIYFNYNNPGQKYATVTVYSNGQSATQGCSNSVNVAGYAVNSYPVYQQPVYQQPIYQPTYQVANNNGLDIGCFVDPTNASVNQPVTWTAEVTGGAAPYTYSWTGSDGLTGSQSSVIKYYGSTGSKSAIVTVTSADGKTGTKACSNAIAIGSSYKSYAKATPAPIAKVVQHETVSSNTGSSLTAASLFTLANVPWGWIAILIILVLFATVMYLLFNKNKI